MDVAIWSIIEQGLAITATSLATLRPLFKLAGHRLGLASQPTALRPYGHKSTPSSGSANQGHLAGRFSERAALSPTSIRRPEAAGRRMSGLNSKFSSGGVGGIRREIKWEVNLSTHFKSESEVELSSPDTWVNKRDRQWV